MIRLPATRLPFAAVNPTLLAHLPAAPAYLAAEGPWLAALDTGGGVWLLEPDSGEPRRVAEVNGEPVGIGFVAGTVMAAGMEGDAVRVDPATGIVERRDIRPTLRFAAAGRVSVRLPLGAKGHLGLRGNWPCTSVVVWDEVEDREVAVFDSPSMDSFTTDAVALSADGRRVAWTGLDIYYTSVGDWGFGQLELLGVADVNGADLLLDVQIGDTSRPSEHRPRPVALAGRHCFAGGYLAGVPDRGPAYRAVRIDDPPFEFARHAAAVGDAGWALVLRDPVFDPDGRWTPEKRERVAVIDLEGRVVAEAFPDAEVAALAAGGGRVFAGLADGRLLRLEAPPLTPPAAG